MKKAILTLLFLGYAHVAQANFTIVLNAGELAGPSGGSPTMQVDNSAGFTNGSLLLVLDLGANGIANSVTAGSFVSSDDKVIGVGGFNTAGGTAEALESILISSANATAGDVIALRWFPQLTLNQYNTGSLPSAGQFFGTYTPTGGGTPDGGNTWVVPSGSSTLNLDFFTSNSTGGGSEAPSAGYANSTVFAAPEPAVYIQLLLAIPFFVWMGRRRMAGALNRWDIFKS